MFTIENLLEAANLMSPDDYDTQDDLVRISEEDAIGILDQLGVENPKERVEWLNCTELDGTSLLALANVCFMVEECDLCGGKEFKGIPNNWDAFQGVLQGEGGVNEINGKEKYICADCFVEHYPLFC